jgi:hypothetical protein
MSTGGIQKVPDTGYFSSEEIRFSPQERRLKGCSRKRRTGRPFRLRESHK